MVAKQLALVWVGDLTAAECARLLDNIQGMATEELSRLRFPLACGRDLHRLREQVEAELFARRDNSEREQVFAREDR